MSSSVFQFFDRVSVRLLWSLSFPIVGLPNFGRFEILNFNIFGVFRKVNISWDMKILWKFFFFWGGGGVITKLE